MADSEQFHLGSYLCPGYELRITRRCLIDDLHMPPTTKFEEACQHQIVGAFLTERTERPTGTNTVGPEAGPRTLYTLRRTDDHRGATWFDEDEKIVWLCAYGRHRSGTPEDAFQHFLELLNSRAIYPNDTDVEALYDDRRRRFVDLAPVQAAGAREAAISSPGTILPCALGHPSAHVVETRVFAEVVDSLAELSFAVRFTTLSPGVEQREITFVQACFATDAETWDLTDRLGPEPIRNDEIAFRLLLTR